MSVANVLPGDTIVVELKYTELLVPTDRVYEFVYPTVVGPRYSEKSESQASPADTFVKAPYTARRRAAAQRVPSDGRGVNRHPRAGDRVAVAYGRLPRDRTGRADMTLADAERFSGNRDFVLRYRLAGETIMSGLLLYQGGGENFFLLMAEPPQAVASDDDSAARIRVCDRRLGLDVRLSAGHGQEAHARSVERAPID